MSSPLIISAVTATLRNIVQEAIDDVDNGIVVTTMPLDKAHDGRVDNQVNIYLYQTSINAAWRNQDPPNRVKPGELGHPALALNLHYLVTAYGANNDEVQSQSLLGAAMIALHDMPVLNPTDILNALGAAQNPGDQFERVRVLHEPLSVEDNSKLWAAFQTNYRLSAAYVASVVLIDSTRATKAALPVAWRGKDRNREGVTTLTAFPVLKSFTVYVANSTMERIGKNSALPGDTLVIRGTGFQAAGVIVRLSNNYITHELAPTSVSETEIRVVIPNNAPNNWPPGYYALGLIVRDAANVLYASVEMPLYLLPTITALPLAPVVINAGTATIQVDFTPEVWDTQRVVLLVGDREVQPPVRGARANSLIFSVPQAVAGQFYVRLRVDGIDSSIINPIPGPLHPITGRFDPTKQVTLQ